MRPPRRSRRTAARQRTGATEGELQPKLQPRPGLAIILADWKSESSAVVISQFNLAVAVAPFVVGATAALAPADESLGSVTFVRQPGGCQGQHVTVGVEQVTGALAPRPVPQAVQ